MYVVFSIERVYTQILGRENLYSGDIRIPASIVQELASRSEISSSKLLYKEKYTFPVRTRPGRGSGYKVLYFRHTCMHPRCCCLITVSILLISLD